MSIKKFRIVLDGVAHEVEVEELGTVNSAPSAATPAAAPGAVHSEPAPATAAPKATATGGENITAPLQGTVLELFASTGQNVKAGQVMVVIEAMKMENEIVAPRDGVVTTVAVNKGDAVASGDLLVTLR